MVVDPLLALVGPGAGISPRRATHFSLLRQRKVSKRKATPPSATLPLRSRAPCGAHVSRGLAELASLKQLRALIRETLRSSAHPEGLEEHPGLCFARPPTHHRREAPVVLRICGQVVGISLLLAERSEGPFGSRFQIPSGCAEERSGSRIRARDCLSEASASETPRTASTAGCPQRSGGSQTAGSPFFCLRFFGEAKKSRSPAGARPGPARRSQRKARSAPPTSTEPTPC